MAKYKETEMDLRVFDFKYNNDLTGAKAIEPRVLLKVILGCYKSGIDRKIPQIFR